MIFDNKL